MKKLYKKIRKKIILIEPKAPGVHVFSYYPLPRLGNIILGTMLKERGFDVTVIAEEIQPVREEIFDGVDVAGISTITSTANRAYSLADRLRERGITVIMGGPHVTYMPEEAILHADYLVLGEGEQVFPDLVTSLSEGEEVKPVTGLVIRGEEISHSPSPLLEDMDSIPIPDFSIVSGMENKTWNAFFRKDALPVQASRGCPFDCNFCSVTGMFGRKCRHKSVGRVMEEIESYDTKRYNLFFYDDNIAANKAWIKELLREFISRKTKFHWYGQVRIDVAKDEELLELMAESHCDHLFIGLESVNPETLKEMNKNQTYEDIRDGIAAIRKRKIGIHGMFVFGFDTDTVETIKNTISFAKKSAINTVQFMILTPLPGTKIFNEFIKDGRTFFYNWSLYDGHHVTFWPKYLDPLSLQKLQLYGHKEFYSAIGLIKKFLTAHFSEAAIYSYARNFNRLWNSGNKSFMNSLNLITRGLKVNS